MTAETPREPGSPKLATKIGTLTAIVVAVTGLLTAINALWQQERSIVC
jgi:hypothetical protein